MSILEHTPPAECAASLGNKCKGTLIAGFNIAADVELRKTLVYCPRGSCIRGARWLRWCAPCRGRNICRDMNARRGRRHCARLSPNRRICCRPSGRILRRVLGYLDEVVPCASGQADLVGNLVYVGIEPEHSRNTRFRHASPQTRYRGCQSPHCGRAGFGLLTTTAIGRLPCALKPESRSSGSMSAASK